MPEHFGFLQAIINDHDDDTPRLIYADWLDEQGQDLRAQLIRAQCLLARCCRREDDDELPLLPAEQILPEYRQLLLAPYFERGFLELAHRYSVGEISGFLFHFRRGFVEGLEVWGAPATEHFAEHADELFRITPLRTLRFLPNDVYGGDYDPNSAASPATLERIVRLPYLSRLHTLDFSRYPNNADFVPVRHLLFALKPCPTFLLPRGGFMGPNPLPTPLPHEEDFPPLADEDEIPF